VQKFCVFIIIIKTLKIIFLQRWWHFICFKWRKFYIYK